MAERIRAARVAEMTGYTVRTVQHLAAQGKIPSAAQLGTIWTFNERSVRLWIKRKESEAGGTCRSCETSFKSTESGIADFEWAGGSLEEAYEQSLKWRPSDA